MTKTTSSPSASTTTSGVDGLLPTDPLYVDTFEEMMAARKATDVRMSDVRYAIWNWRGRIVHIFGWHTWVPLEEWDVEHGWMRYVGMSCWHCQKVIRE